MVFGVAGNKCDLFQEEEVSEEEGKKFAKSIGAIFHFSYNYLIFTKIIIKNILNKNFLYKIFL